MPHGFHVPALALLGQRDFRNIWLVGSLFEIGRRMELLILSLLILETTNSPLLLGLVLAFNHLPRPLFSLFTGLIADRVRRRKIMVVAELLNLLAVGTVLTLIISDRVAPWHVFAAIFIQGACRALEDPARRTGILDIVGAGRLVNALSLDTISNTVGKMIGPMLAGALVAGVGYWGAYLAVLMVHLATLLMLTQVRIPDVPAPRYREPLWRSLGAAFRFAFHTPMLLGMLYLTIIMNALAFPSQQFIPAIGRDQLQVGPALVGILVASEGIGQLIGAFTMAATRNLRHQGRVFVAGCVAVLVMAFLWVWSPWYAVTFMLIALSGAGMAAFGTMQSSINLLSAPPNMRGRLTGLLSVCIGIGTPLGAFEMGLLADHFGAPLAISINVVAGLLLLLPAALFTPLIFKPMASSPGPSSAS